MTSTLPARSKHNLPFLVTQFGAPDDEAPHLPIQFHHGAAVATSDNGAVMEAWGLEEHSVVRPPQYQPVVGGKEDKEEMEGSYRNPFRHFGGTQGSPVVIGKTGSVVRADSVGLPQESLAARQVVVLMIEHEVPIVTEFHVEVEAFGLSPHIPQRAPE